MIPRLHLVTDLAILQAPAFPRRAGEALEAGGALVALHLRGPGMGARRLLELARLLVRAARRDGARLVVSDRVDVALLAEADGAHLPQAGLPVETARRLLPRGALVGRSVHEPEGAGAGGARPDYLLAGTIFQTPSHPGRKGAGPSRIAEVCRAAGGVPVLGIGGITADRIAPVLEAGAHGVAVLRAVWDAPDPGRAVERLLGEIAAVRDRGGPGRQGTGPYDGGVPDPDDSPKRRRRA